MLLLSNKKVIVISKKIFKDKHSNIKTNLLDEEQFVLSLGNNPTIVANNICNSIASDIDSFVKPQV